MGIKQDWFERQIEAIGQGLAALLFGKDKVEKVFEEFREVRRTNDSYKTDEILLDVLINQHVKKGEFLEAEETLFSFMEREHTLNMFITAMNFYNQLLCLGEDKLKESGFSKEKIAQSIEKLKQIYNV